MRVVSLLPSATEIVAALGAMNQIVGVTHECDFPAEVATRARVTACDVDADATPGAIDAQVRTLTGEGRSLYTLDETLIRTLRPDLIVTQALCDVCAVMETDVRALAERLMPMPAVVSLSATTLDGVFVDIERAGAAMGREIEAANLVAALRRRMRAVHDTLSAARAPRARVAVIEWTDPVFAAGHWVPEMVRRAGGIDVLASEGEHSRVVPIERIAEAGPAVVVFAPCGYGLEHAVSEARALLADPDWCFLGGCDVWALDANALTSRPGPRLVDGVEVMAQILNPPLFTPVDSSRAVLVHARVTT